MKLLFLSNNLMLPSTQQQMRLPIKFISYAKMEGQLFYHFRNTDTFVFLNRKNWGNKYVYGGLFLLDSFEYYIEMIDSYYICSMSKLLGNHKLDLHHRIVQQATPISITTLEDIRCGTYIERESIDVYVYVGNPNHPKITKRLTCANKHSYRIVNGIYDKGMNKLMEVNNDRIRERL